MIGLNNANCKFGGRGDMKNVTFMYTKNLYDRLSFVACVVKEYKPNGLGDLILIVKVVEVIFCS